MSPWLTLERCRSLPRLKINCYVHEYCMTEVPHSFAVFQCKDFAASHVKGKEESKMSLYLLDRVSVVISSGGLKGHVNQLNSNDSFFFSFK